MEERSSTPAAATDLDRTNQQVLGAKKISTTATGDRKSTARQAFEDCPLIEIVHFHECLRGELRSLRANVETLCAQMLSLQPGDPQGPNAGDEAKECENHSSAPLAREHVDLEVQVQSQFRLLWAVFQSHSTAEDEVIWPALKEKALSTGGKLTLINHEGKEREDASSPSPPSSPPSASSPNAVSLQAPAHADQSNASNEKEKDETSTIGDKKHEEFGEAIINESEYTEEHSHEQRLFEGMQELLTGLRNSRQNLQERRRVIAGLGTRTNEMCRHLMTHLDKEEEGALPLIRHYFTRHEMESLVGKIMGKRPTELMETILAMMVKNLPPGEVWTVLGYMRHAVKDTYFEKWLSAGGFQWPTNTGSKSATVLDDEPGETNVPSRNGQGTSPSPKQDPFNISSVSGHTLMLKRMAGPLGLDSPGKIQREKEGGKSTEAATMRGVVDDEFCGLRREFGGLSLRSGVQARNYAPPLINEPSSVEPEANNVARSAKVGNTGCNVCDYVGRCPVNQPLSQEEFESAVRRLTHVDGLSTEQKNVLVQEMRNHMYEGRKRPRPNGPEANAASHGPLDTALLAGKPLWKTGSVPAGGWDKVAASGGLLPPARHLTSTQPNMENNATHGSRSGECGQPRGTVSAPLFTRAELAPTYHVVAPGAPAVELTNNSQGSADDGQAGNSTNTEAWHGRGKEKSGSMREQKVLGCPHYRRACKMRAPCCQRLFTCRLCHDQASDHTVDRQDVKEMLCMRCGTLQPMHSECRNTECQVTDGSGGTRRIARYYCGICHLFDDAPGKDIYHCPYCNVCRLGKGLGEDFFHCMTCNACISMKTPNHTCLSKSLEIDCPICSTSLFSSTSQVKGLKCGHFMHLQCYKEYIRRAESREFWYRCPVCRKSVDDMQEYFSQMDAVVASQPMPEEYSGWRTKVLCHDCEHYTEVPYHFYYLKCGACGSYNTRKEEQVTRDVSGRTNADTTDSQSQGDSDRSAPPGP